MGQKVGLGVCPLGTPLLHRIIRSIESQETSYEEAIRTVLALAAALTLGAAAQAQEVTLKFHHIWNPQAMASVHVIAPWCDKIAKESANKLKCQVLPAMSMGGTPPQLVDRSRTAWTTWSSRCRATPQAASRRWRSSSCRS